MEKFIDKISESMTISTFAATAGEKAKTAIIDIEGVIGDPWSDSPNTSAQMRKELKAIGNLKADEIIVNIHSPGGSVDHGLAIHDILRENRAKIITKTYGTSASSATIIAQAGDVRLISANSLYLVHRCWSIVVANALEMEDQAKDNKKHDSRIADIYAKRSSRTKEYMLELMDRQNGNGVWMEPEEVLEHGLADEVFEPEPQQAAAAASVNRDFAAFAQKMHLPELPENWKKHFAGDFATSGSAQEPPQKTNLTAKEPETINAKQEKPVKQENTMGNQTNYKEFREAFGAEAAFGYLEAGLTFDQANAAHALVTPLENKVKSLEGEKAQLQSDLDAANEQIKDFQNEKPLDPDNAIPPKDPKDEKEEPDPVADFEAKVVEQIPAGKEDDPDAKAAARNKAADANPELYEQYLAAYNQK